MVQETWRGVRGAAAPPIRTQRTRQRLLWRVAAVPLSLITFVAVASYGAGTMFLAPHRFAVGPPPPDLKAENVSFRGSNGATLKGWFVRGAASQGAVILIHGIHGSRLNMLDRAEWLRREGYSVLLFDLQASGESGGDFITFGHRESEDAAAAFAFVRERLPHEKVGVIGVSLGGAAAVLASPPLPVNALVIESVFPDIHDAIHDRMAMQMPFAADALTSLLLTQLRPRLGFPPSALRPEESIRTVQAPIFVLAGTADRHTRLAESERLFAAAPEPKQFWPVPGAAHENLMQYVPDEYRRCVGAFLAKNLR